MPSEDKFLIFFFFGCVRVSNNFFVVQIKLKLILKLTGNGLVMRWSHNTAAISPKRVQVFERVIHHLAVKSGELLIVHVLLPALQQRYSGSGVKGPIMLLIGHCNSSKNTFLQMHRYGVLCLIIRLT